MKSVIFLCFCSVFIICSLQHLQVKTATVYNCVTKKKTMICVGWIIVMCVWCSSDSACLGSGILPNMCSGVFCASVTVTNSVPVALKFVISQGGLDSAQVLTWSTPWWQTTWMWRIIHHTQTHTAWPILSQCPEAEALYVFMALSAVDRWK